MWKPVSLPNWLLIVNFAMLIVLIVLVADANRRIKKLCGVEADKVEKMYSWRDLSNRVRILTENLNNPDELIQCSNYIQHPYKPMPCALSQWNNVVLDL